jgi:hypothetical protein
MKVVGSHVRCPTSVSFKLQLLAAGISVFVFLVFVDDTALLAGACKNMLMVYYGLNYCT